MRTQSWTHGSRYGILKNSITNNKIIFYVNGDKYTVNEGMTWEELIYSDYNQEIGELFIPSDNSENVLYKSGMIQGPDGNVRYDDLIKNNYNYQTIFN